MSLNNYHINTKRGKHLHVIIVIRVMFTIVLLQQAEAACVATGPESKRCAEQFSKRYGWTTLGKLHLDILII